MRKVSGVLLTLCLAVIASCASPDHAPVHPPGVQTAPTPSGAVLDLPADLTERILALNYDSLSARDVRDVLSHAPAPRILVLDGSIPIVSMDSLSRFLIGMGYPEQSVRDPRSGSLTYSSYQSAERLAGMIAWHYEKEGMMPILIGHSQGGMRVIKILHELAGSFRSRIEVRDPHSGEPEGRYTIADPLTGRGRPVRGLKIGFASAIAAGRLMRVLLGQWDMLGRLRQVPGTVEEFTGFHIRSDLIGSGLSLSEQDDRYVPTDSAAVRNVWLPSSYSHITIPLTEDLAGDSASRTWIEAYRPGAVQVRADDTPTPEYRNILFAADLWYSVKKYWCIELQRLIRAGDAEKTAY